MNFKACKELDTYIPTPRTLSILEGESGSKLKNIEKPGISRRHLDIDVHRTLGAIKD